MIDAINSNVSNEGFIGDPALNEHFDVKILFGSLHGCEFHLPVGDYFFITDSDSKDLTSQLSTKAEPNNVQASLNQNILYLPCNSPTPNFHLHIKQRHLASGDDDMFSIAINISEDDNPSIHELVENQIFNSGNIRLVIKKSTHEWNYTSLDLDTEHPLVSLTSQFTIKNFIISTVTLLTLIVLSVFLLWRSNSSSEQHIQNIDNFLSDSPTPISILNSRDTDPAFYVLTSDYHEIEWLREAITKYTGEERISPVFIPQVQKNTIEKLRNNGLPVLQLNLDTVQHPEILIQRSLTTNEQSKLKQIIAEQLPFVIDTKTKIVSPNSLIDIAKGELDKLHIFYKVIQSAHGSALIIHEELSDTQLYSLKNFIKDFYANWGNKSVTFSINLDEDWLNDKSYVNAAYSYVFLTPKHWYFPNSTMENH